MMRFAKASVAGFTLANAENVADAVQQPSVTGGALKLAYSDCGDGATHGKFTSLSPTSVTLGDKTPLKGKGTIDENIQAATYEVVAKALFVTVFKHSGDACKAESIKLPAGAGTIDMHGFNCPLAKGDVELDLDLNLAGSIPAQLARLTIDLKAKTTTGDKALCAQIKTSPATDVFVEAADVFAGTACWKPGHDLLFWAKTLADGTFQYWPQDRPKDIIKSNHKLKDLDLRCRLVESEEQDYWCSFGELECGFTQCWGSKLDVCPHSQKGTHVCPLFKSCDINDNCHHCALQPEVDVFVDAARREGLALTTAANVADTEQQPEVDGGALKLAYSDCGDSATHGRFTSLSPTSVTLGNKTPLKGKGTIDENIQAATYEVDAKTHTLHFVFKHSGNACKAESINLPAGAGTIDMHGFKCPLAKGDVELDLDLNLAGSIPAQLARLTIDLKAKTNTGDKALCAQIKTLPAAEVNEEVMV